MHESQQPGITLRPSPPSSHLTRDLVEAAMEGSGVGIWDWDISSGRSSYTPFNGRRLAAPSRSWQHMSTRTTCAGCVSGSSATSAVRRRPT